MSVWSGWRVEVNCIGDFGGGVTMSTGDLVNSSGKIITGLSNEKRRRRLEGLEKTGKERPFRLSVLEPVTLEFPPYD